MQILFNKGLTFYYHFNNHQSLIRENFQTYLSSKKKKDKNYKILLIKMFLIKIKM